jgi:hypothetical protein
MQYIFSRNWLVDKEDNVDVSVVRRFHRTLHLAEQLIGLILLCSSGVLRGEDITAVTTKFGVSHSHTIEMLGCQLGK